MLKGATGVVDFGVVRVPQGGRRRSTVRRVTPPAPPLPSGPAPPIVSFGRAESCANAPLQDLPPTGETGSTMVGVASLESELVGERQISLNPPPNNNNNNNNNNAALHLLTRATSILLGVLAGGPH